MSVCVSVYVCILPSLCSAGYLVRFTILGESVQLAVFSAFVLARALPKRCLSRRCGRGSVYIPHAAVIPGIYFALPFFCPWAFPARFPVRRSPRLGFFFGRALDSFNPPFARRFWSNFDETKPSWLYLLLCPWSLLPTWAPVDSCVVVVPWKIGTTRNPNQELLVEYTVVSYRYITFIDAAPFFFRARGFVRAGCGGGDVQVESWGRSEPDGRDGG